MGEPNAGLCRTLSLAAHAWTKRHHHPLARQLFGRVRAHSGRVILIRAKMGEPNAGLCRTLSSAACAWTKRHRHHWLGSVICFGVSKHCHRLLVLELSITAAHWLGSVICFGVSKHCHRLLVLELSVTAAHWLGSVICFGVRKLWPPSRHANVAETWLCGYSGNCQVDFVQLCLKCGQ